MIPEQVAVTLTVAGALDALGVPYAIGGSFASSLHGAMRATMDADLVAALGPEHVEPLLRALGDDFYVDADALYSAVFTTGSCNLIHLETLFKVDLFIAKPRAFDRAQLVRRQWVLLSADPERGAYVSTAEDAVLSKLEWYRMGGEVSDRQWRDVQGVLQVQGARLDCDYLRAQATELGVGDLLESAFLQAGLA